MSNSWDKTKESKTKASEIVETFQDEDQRLIAYGIKTIVRGVAVIFIVFFSSIAACGMMDNLTSTLQGDYEREKAIGQATIEEAKAKAVEAQIQLEKSQSKAIKELIDSGIPPLEARCAVLGWETGSDPDDICEKFAPQTVVDNPGISVTINGKIDGESDAKELSVKDGDQ